jgi:NTP pyrophosphatase (non-canonical NTP hydrolase)
MPGRDAAVSWPVEVKMSIGPSGVNAGLDFLIQRALEVRQEYAELEKEKHGRSWTTQEIVLGLVGDLGDLAKLVMAAEGMRSIPDARQKLAHELADCLWSILVLSRLYGIDLEAAFLRTMDQLEGHIALERKRG